MAKFVLKDGETVIRGDKGMWLKSKLRGFGARLYLTDQRLVIARTGIPSLGLIGMLFNKEGNVSVELSRADVTGLQPSTHGRAKNVMEISTKDGTAYKFIAGTPVEEWKAAILGWAQS